MNSHSLLSLMQRNLDRVIQRIQQACAQAGREDRPQLIAVTKYAPDVAVEALLKCGHVDLGESRVQQLNQRAEQFAVCTDQPVRWHMIGHLQRKKAKQAIERACLIHSVDTLRLLEAIEQACQDQHKQIEVLLQFNISGEESKSGFAVTQMEEVIAVLPKLHFVKIRGLMTMAPYTDDEAVVRSTFQGLAELRKQWEPRIAAPHSLSELSMGMSHDLELAIDAGATMIRVGTDLFLDVPGYGQ